MRLEVTWNQTFFDICSRPPLPRSWVARQKIQDFPNLLLPSHERVGKEF